jgi:hypothetical protein
MVLLYVIFKVHHNISKKRTPNKCIIFFLLSKKHEGQNEINEIEIKFTFKRLYERNPQVKIKMKPIFRISLIL